MDGQRREEATKVTGIATARRTVEAGPGQFFCKTPKAWELWQREPLKMVKRWSRKSVFWVFEGGEG